MIRTIAEWPRFAQSVGFVPTMGAFHEGHLHLMRTAKQEQGTCAVSLFVNPTQFGPNEDFSRYPRQEERDFEMAEAAGVDWMFAPSVEEMYASRATSVSVSGVSERWDGAYRPGHFDGVATVVAKLFHIVGASHAYFGQKDFQQCAVIARMVNDLNFPVTLRFIETVREADGLAMSSRNAYLTPEERALAPALIHSLRAIRSKVIAGAMPSDCISEESSRLAALSFQLDYLALVNGTDLEPIDQLEADARLLVAAKLGKTRLIDNLSV